MAISERDKANLDELDKLAHRLIFYGYDFRYDRDKVLEVISLASRYSSMEIRRRELMHWFEKFEKYKRASKKEDAWHRVTNSLWALSVATGHVRAASGEQESKTKECSP